MKKVLTQIACLLFASFLVAQSSSPLQVKEIKLKNGLTVWLNEDHTQPKVFGAMVVKAGSKDSPDTGIAHYFEHIMFKGTDRIGTTDYTAEKIYLDSIAGKYDELSQTKEEEQRTGIQREINRLSIKAAQYAIPNEYSRLISRYGGTGLNAFTSYDCTVYLNTFSPQYFRQWAELNSERLIHPVFRLFQNELETVYEEKNMYNDNMVMNAIEKFSEHFFAPHPYSYPVIGSTENLKNPRLSEMEEFFENYYVAGNMGLIISGDFNPDEVTSVLEATFGRIRPGEAPARNTPVPAAFRGREEIKIKVPIPLIKMMARGYRGVPAGHPDEATLKIALRLLNNDNGTGYLDLLSVNHKVLEAQAFCESLNDAGMIGILVIPKLMFQSKSKAEKIVMQEVERLKNGDFSKELFNNVKLEYLAGYDLELENIDSRANNMIFAFSQGKVWDEYLAERRRIESITPEAIQEVIRKYIGNDYLFASKKAGSYPKNKLKKPPFEPIIPSHTDTTSDYAGVLEQIGYDNRPPRYIDFNRDAQRLQLSPNADLYVTSNPVNELFSVTLNFKTGTVSNPATSLLSSYLELLGTDSLTFEQFRNKLQTLGSKISFNSSKNSFKIEVTGFDKNFGETMILAGNFLKHVKADENKINSVKTGERVSEKSLFKSPDGIADAAFEKVVYGPQSTYLTKLSYDEIKKIKGTELIDLFGKIKKTACSVHYSGQLSADEVSKGVARLIEIEEITEPSSVILFRDRQIYDQPAVYFYDQPNTSQSIIYGYVPNSTDIDDRTRAASILFSNYFGEDMSSLMFQELREFRSYAYRAYGTYALPAPGFKEKGSALITMLSTQSDKTTEAMSVLDSLIRFMPDKPQKVTESRQKFMSEVNNNFPGFRDISLAIDNYRLEGYSTEPNEAIIALQKQMGMDEVKEFYTKNIKNRPVVYVVVGDSKKINMEKLATFGNIIKLKKEEIYK